VHDAVKRIIGDRDAMLQFRRRGLGRAITGIATNQNKNHQSKAGSTNPKRNTSPKRKRVTTQHIPLP